MNVEDAEKVIVDWIKNKMQLSTYSRYGYDVYIRNVIRESVPVDLQAKQPEIKALNELSPTFYGAAWELCRRGILRPGTTTYNGQVVSEGCGGAGFSITPFGWEWIKDENSPDIALVETGRFANILEPYRHQFGSGFYDRAMQGIKCYKAHAYLACCAMCGASAESILLAIAIAKDGDEEKILKTYVSGSGRSRIKTQILGQAKSYIRREFEGYMSLLSYWRDESAHGQISNISDNEAYLALTTLLRFSIFADKNWVVLTQ